MSEINYENWEPVIGLEIHAQLKTKTKLFTRTPNHFGDEPNTNIDEVDTGQPGALPILNREAVRKAVLFGLSIKAEIAHFSSFDRKSYFYPDNPRNFQITQFFNPIIKGGTITCDVEGKTKHFKVNRAHLEDDTGMLKHFSTFAGIDFNRAGIPLIEIVSEPMMHSPKDASAYAKAIRAIMLFLDVSDCSMEEGSLRIDSNVSVRKRGEKELRPKIEIKNMNSFHNMELALESEIRRQIQAYSRTPHAPHEEVIEPGTYRFDLPTKTTKLMRKKESVHDYRYFPEADLVPIILEESYINKIKETLPELPHDRYLRYVSDHGISPDSAAILVADKYTSDFFEEALKVGQNPTSVCNWIISEFAGRLKEKGITLQASGLKSLHVGNLVKLTSSGAITGKMAKLVADDMLAKPGIDPQEIVKANPDYQPVQDTSIIEPIVDEVIKNNPQSIIDYHAGKARALSFLVGQVMKQTQGKASPEVVNQLLKDKMGEKP